MVDTGNSIVAKVETLWFPIKQISVLAYAYPRFTYNLLILQFAICISSTALPQIQEITLVLEIMEGAIDKEPIYF